jgi:hypothetical protein
MLAESLLALASVAGRTVVQSAASDAWETTRRGFARLLGRGYPDQERGTEGRLDETRRELTGSGDSDLEKIRPELESQWTTRVKDLLEDDPDAEPVLRTLVQDIQAQLPAGVVSAADHSIAAGRDINVTASGNGVAAGSIHGNVTSSSLQASGSAVFAHSGGVAVRKVENLNLPDQRPTQPVALLPRPVYLVGREKMLADLDARLSAGGVSWPRITVLFGMGGAGKTSVALEYAHRHLADTGLAWQFTAEDSAEDPTVFATEFRRLATQLGVKDLVSQQEPVAAVHAVLAVYPVGWLLIFDNAPDRAALEPFLPPSGRGRILITSQNHSWPPGQAIEVGVLDPGSSADFLVNRTGDPDRQAAALLAAEVGGLPLALEQAAAYMQATGNLLADYLTLFRQKRAVLLGKGEPTGHTKTVATTWALAFTRLEQSQPGAAGLLRLLAWFAPEAIPLRLLQPSTRLAGQFGPNVAPILVPLLDEPLEIGDAIAALRRYSLVNPAGHGEVTVHRLVQAVTLDQMPGEESAQWRQAAGALIEAAIPADTSSPETWPDLAALLSHAQAALTDDSVGMALIASYLGNSGSHAAARDLYSRIAHAREEVCGSEHPATLTAREALAGWTGEAGDAVAARDQLAKLLPVMERALGAEDTKTLMARFSLARWNGQAGDPARACEQFKELLPDVRQALGPRDIETFKVRAGLAGWTGEAGDAVGARDQFETLLPDVKDVLGSKAPETLTYRGWLARWTGEAGNPAGARDQFREVLPDLEQAFGAEHPATLKILASVAGWTGEAGDPAGAREQFKALLSVVRRVFGLRHPETLTDRASLARWTGEAGDQAGAREQFRELLPDVKDVFGPYHPETLNDRANLAHWTGEAGDAAGAREQFKEVLPDAQKLLGSKHPVTLRARANLARWTGEAGDPAAARERFAALLPDMEKELGPNYPDTLRAARWNRRMTEMD